jgi:lipoprotein signal peptidase
MAFLSLFIAALLIAADQVSKYFVIQNLKPIGSVPVIEGFFNLTYLENKGAAFGFMQNLQWFFIPATIIGCTALTIVLFRYKKHTFLSYVSLLLVIAGGIGNLIDRIYLGYVVDFFDFPFFGYIFNVADCCVTVGAVLLIITVFLHDKRDRVEKQRELENSESGEDESEESGETESQADIS